MPNINKKIYTALIFMLLVGAILSSHLAYPEEVSCIRIPVGIDGDRAQSLVALEKEKKKKRFIDRIYTAKRNLGIRENEEIDMERLSAEMGYKNADIFISSANIQAGLKTKDLQALGVREKKSSHSTSKTSLEEKRRRFLDRIKEVKNDLGIGEGEKIDIQILVDQMGYKDSQSFKSTAYGLGFRLNDLEAMGVVKEYVSDEKRREAKRNEFMDRINAAKDAMGIEEGERVDMEELSAKMGYKHVSAFKMTLTKLRVTEKDLQRIRTNL